MGKDLSSEIASVPVETAILLEGLKEGNEWAFASLFNQYADLLLSYGTGLGFNREDIEDAIQEVFCNLYLKHQHIAEIRNLKFYLLRALKNTLLNIVRTVAGLQEADVEELDFHAEVDVTDGLINEEEREDLKQKVELYLNSLTNRQREAIYLRYMEELEYEEIASLMDMTVPSVRNLVFRAIKQLRDTNLPTMIVFAVLPIVK